MITHAFILSYFMNQWQKTGKPALPVLHKLQGGFLPIQYQSQMDSTERQISKRHERKWPKPCEITKRVQLSNNAKGDENTFFKTEEGDDTLG